MAEFKMSRNGSGYYDETAFKAMMQMAKPGEVWKYKSASQKAKDKTFLILKNHERFCSALALFDDPDENCIEVATVGGLKLFTDVRMVQYIYNSELTEYIARIPDACFENILDEIGLMLGIQKKCEAVAAEPKIAVNETAGIPEDQTPNPLESKLIAEMLILFGTNAVKHYLMCNVYKHKCENEEKTADLYMKQLIGLAGGY